ncbi:peptide chain release factor family protein [Variovorax atrisoli]|uniref:peptide chain release factor family protein n=1 Tax=Variovorax atrisoli TaxID=3394203 RepID=UPI000362EDF4|nr:peptide chain release factor-like protein [Variovorax paradoxus]
MTGYFEMEVIERSEEACDALKVLFRFIVNSVDKAEVVATTFDKALGNSTAETLVVPDAEQFDRLEAALRALDTLRQPAAYGAEEDRPPLLRLTCYRDQRSSRHAVSEDDLAIEYFNARPHSDNFMFHSDSAARLTHEATGITTVSDGARSRHRNLAQARDMLNAKLAENPAPLHLNERSVRALRMRLATLS